MDEKQAVRNAVDQWMVALNAMLNGDPAPFAEIYSHGDDIAYMSAQGTYCIGWEATYADWKLQAGKALGGKADAADIHVLVGTEMAVAHHRTNGSVNGPNGQMVDVAMRETSVLRKEDGLWKVVSHHADDLSLWESVVNQQ